jgi:hypothetical protein
MIETDGRYSLDEELSRLPDRYRAVIVLCDLEGLSRKEVARQLGCPEGTVASRLARAREMLARRLTQRGVVVSGLAVVSRSAAGMSSAIKAADLIGKTVIPLKVAALAEGVLKAMLLAKLKAVVAVVLMLGLVGCVPGLTMLRGQEAVSHTAADKTGSEKPKGEKSTAGLLRDRADVRQAERELMVAGLDVEVARARFFPKGDKPSYRAFDPKYLSFPPGDWTVPRVNKAAIRAEYTRAYLEPGQCRIVFAGLLTTHPELATGSVEFEVKPAKESITAWGKEVGGLQAGLSMAEKRAYQPPRRNGHAGRPGSQRQQGGGDVPIRPPVLP